MLVKFMLILLARYTTYSRQNVQKIALLLLRFSLFLANSLMFYKLWGLEERLLVTTPPPPSPSKSSRGGDRLPIKSFDTLENLLQFTDYQKVSSSSDSAATSSGSGGHMEPIEWMKLLHRQELIHQMELEKWHDLIGAATELLRQVKKDTIPILLIKCLFFNLFFQTEHSLTDLQKSIHPLALQKMRGLMFLQNEDWERILSHPAAASSAKSNLHHHYQPSEQHHYKSTTTAYSAEAAAATTTSEKTTTNPPSQIPEGAHWKELPADKVDMSLSRGQK